MNHQLVIKVEGVDLGKGRIPVTILNKVLKSVQSTVFTIGEYEVTGGNVSRERGPFPRSIQENYTLELVNTAVGSFIMGLDFPEKSSNTSDVIFKKYHEIIEYVSSDQPKKISGIIPDQRTRNRVLNSIKEMLPKQDDYKVFVKGATSEYTSPISTRELKNIERMLSKPKEEIRELIGRIVELKIHGDAYVGIYNGSRVIRCTPSDVENEVFTSIGKEVLVRGEAIVTASNEIQELISIDEAIIAEPGKWFISDFSYAGIYYEMVEDFHVNLDYIESYWTIEHKKLGLYISESSFREAIKACYLELSFLWEEYVESPDEELTNDAIILKQLIKQSMEKVALGNESEKS